MLDLTELLKNTDSSVLILITVILFSTVNMLAGIVLYFAKRHIKDVDSKFIETNSKIENQTQTIGDLVSEVQTTQENIRSGFVEIHRALGIATVETERQSSQITQVMEECKRLDHRVERTEEKLDRQSESFNQHYQRILALIGHKSE